MDKFEKKILNMAPLNVEEAPDGAWEKIKTAVPGKKQVTHWWRVAAVLFFISTAGILVWTMQNQQPAKSIALGDISREYKQLERHYQSDVQRLMSSISWTEDDRTEFAWIFEELNLLDEMKVSYEEDLAKTGKTEQVVPILIDYYEKKIKLLKKLELEINRKRHEKEVNEFI